MTRVEEEKTKCIQCQLKVVSEGEVRYWTLNSVRKKMKSKWQYQQYFYDISPQVSEIEEKISKGDCIKIKILYSNKNHKQTKRY